MTATQHDGLRQCPPSRWRGTTLRPLPERPRGIRAYRSILPGRLNWSHKSLPASVRRDQDTRPVAREALVARQPE